MDEVEQALSGQEPGVKESQQLISGSLRIDLATRVAVLGETPLELAAKELNLLCHFARHPGWVYSRQELLEHVWGYGYGEPQVVTVHIANLRKKAKAVVPGYQLIETVQSVGYQLVSPPATHPDLSTAAASQTPSKKHNGTVSSQPRSWREWRFWVRLASKGVHNVDRAEQSHRTTDHR
ncbi:MAG: response regulator transcription factor [Thermoleophilia bacterium]|nr:response regulator transcription factor [Thermoleophilia bacterium]